MRCAASSYSWITSDRLPTEKGDPVPIGAGFFLWAKIQTALRTIVPFQSEAQRRKFYAMQERGEISKEKVREYEKETKGDLPERVKKAKEAKGKAKKFMKSKKSTTEG